MTSSAPTPSASSLLFVPAEEVLRFGYPRAVDAIEVTLRNGLDPASDPHRSSTPVGDRASLLFMPSVSTDAVGVKLITKNPDNPGVDRPAIQGTYVLFDRPTLTPVAVLDGAALTTLRTPAVSLAAARRALQRFDRPLQIVIFGVGPQGVGHLDALAEVALRDRDFPPPGRVTFVARRDPADRLPRRPGTDISGASAGTPAVERAVAEADVVVCATTASSPLFDWRLLGRHSVTLAVGSHSPEAAEIDPAFCAGSQVIVEDVATALRECGEIMQAARIGAVAPADLTPLVDVVRSAVSTGSERPVLFKGAGMAWEDLAVADAIVTELLQRG